MTESNAIATVDYAPVTAKALQDQVNVIQQAMRQVMKEGVHYGSIPGCGDKPTLLKPGAEKICLLFRLNAAFKIAKTELGNGHREYEIICTLNDAHGRTVGQGVGLCTTMETKYRYRQGERFCPKCGKAAIIKGREEYGGGWLCFAKKSGCGAKFPEGDKSIEGQAVGQVDNANVADTYNTILKIAKKRAHVDATLMTTAASDIFTQDIEDMGPPEYVESAPRAPEARPKAAEPASTVTYYSIHDLEGSAMKKAQEYLEANRASFDDDLGVWVAPIRLSKLTSCIVAKPEPLHTDDPEIEDAEIVETPKPSAKDRLARVKVVAADQLNQ